MGINVLSCFDGISAGLEALQNAGISVDNYYSFEIDKYAIQISQKNHPMIRYLGDITNWEFYSDIPKIDLLIGGSPCQGFSIAGNHLNFDDHRSKLFFTFVDILNHHRKLNPDMKFLLENVYMKAEWRDIISNALGVQPIMIDSALVSAQSRKRYYWTNIANIEQPEQRNIFLQDIIEGGWYSDREKAYCIDANYYKGGNYKSYFGKGRRQIVFDYPIQVGVAEDIKGHDFLKRVYSGKGKSPTLTAMTGGNQERKIAVDDKHWRMLTPVESERLQCFPDNYTKGVSNTQRYKMLGNSWTVDVITWIFSYLADNIES